jgi:tetratricopeptide (TPR) repeat protein
MTQLPAPEVVAAANQLMLAGQWTTAANLLAAATPDDPTEGELLALARAEVAVDHDFGRRTDHATPALAASEAVLRNSWDLALLAFRKAYSDALFRSGDGNLRARAQALIETAPDDRRRGAANFWAGAMADNVYEQPAEALEHYRTALELAEKSGDELMTAQALRHLGYHAHAAGDLTSARAQWERSTELLQKAGHLRPALAQQAMLAGLHRDEGDVDGSRALATEVNRWARQLGIPFIVAETAELMAPQTPPERLH